MAHSDREARYVAFGRTDAGGCFAYALATVRGEPLLHKGDDFARTDVVAAAPAVRA